MNVCNYEFTVNHIHRSNSTNDAFRHTVYVETHAFYTARARVQNLPCIALDLKQDLTPNIHIWYLTISLGTIVPTFVNML